MSRHRLPASPIYLRGTARLYTEAVVCSDGTWMAPSDVHGQTAGARKESEMAQDPGGPGQPLTGKRQQWRETVDCQLAAWPVAKLRQRSGAAGRRVDRDINRRRRGCREATHLGRATAPLPVAER